MDKFRDTLLLRQRLTFNKNNIKEKGHLGDLRGDGE
jgi:hypothetical protein